MEVWWVIGDCRGACSLPGSHAVPRAVIAWFTWCRSSADLSKFEQFEAERFDLREDAEHSRTVLEQAGEHGLAALQLTDHRREGGEGGSPEPTLDPDRVQARRCGHVSIVPPYLVTRRRRNPVIAS